MFNHFICLQSADKEWGGSFEPQTQNGQCVGEHHVCGAVQWLREIEPKSPPKSLADEPHANQFIQTLESKHERISNDFFNCDILNSMRISPTDEAFWQERMCNVQEKNAALFNNELMSDVRFVFFQKGLAQEVSDLCKTRLTSSKVQLVVPAHKHILGMGSR